MTPLITTRTILVSALFRRFGSTIQFLKMFNQAVLSREAGYRQSQAIFFPKEKDMDIIMNVDEINSQIVYYHCFQYELIFSIILVNRNYMLVCHLR